MTPTPAIEPPHRMSRTLVGAACLSLQPLVLNALSVPALAYIIRRLGSEAYGRWMAPAAILAIGSMVANLGSRGAFVRRVASEPRVAAQALGEQLGLRLSLAVPAAMLSVLACALLGYPAVAVWCAAIGAIGLLLATISSTLVDTMQALQRIPTVAAVNLVAGLVLTGASVAAAALAPLPVAMALAYLSGPLVAALVLARAVRREIGPVRLGGSAGRYMALLRESRYLAAQQALGVGAAQVDALLLPRLVGLSTFGIFTAGTIPANRLGVLPDGLCTAAYPVLSRTFARSPHAAGQLMRRYLLVATMGGIAIALGGTLVAEPVGRLLFPGDPGAFSGVMRITLWTLPLVCADSVLGYALNAAGRDGALAKLMTISTVAGLVGSAALVLELGVAGACWAMLVRPALRVAVLLPIAIRTFRAAPDTSVSADVRPIVRVGMSAGKSKVAA